jgi:hypothetical protein
LLKEDQLHWRRKLVARTLQRQGRFLKRVCHYDESNTVVSADWYVMTPAEIELKASRSLHQRRCWVKDPNFELDVIVGYQETKKAPAVFAL